MKANKYAKVFAIVKQLNVSGLNITYQEIVKNFTDGRTESLSSLGAIELQELEKELVQMTAKPLSKEDQERDTMRKGIIAIFKSIGRTTEAAIAWAEKYGVNGQKKPFNDYTKQELFLLIRNAERAKKDHITAVNK